MQPNGTHFAAQQEVLAALACRKVVHHTAPHLLPKVGQRGHAADLQGCAGVSSYSSQQVGDLQNDTA